MADVWALLINKLLDNNACFTTKANDQFICQSLVDKLIKLLLFILK